MVPRVSVIIATYNRETLLPDAIESVFSQTHRDLELIVADDGSTDDTRGLLATYGSRLRALFLPHAGSPTPVLNAGIRAARGEFIAFLDSDDVWLPDKLARQLALFDRQPRLGFVYGNLVFLDPDGTISGPVVPSHQLRSGTILRDLVRDMFVHPSTLVVRRALLDQVGLLEAAAGPVEHYSLLLRLARASEAGCIPEPVALIRRHAGQFNLVHGARQYEYTIMTLERLASGPLPWSVRFEVRRTLARHQTHLARVYLSDGDRNRAHQHLVRAIRAYPLHRPTWRWVLRALIASWSAPRAQLG
ncbi:MAG: glycosyltransferase [Ardenticatenaceae bacterium]|nr:glycosyltransferase [Ardenticatenaceae bacterium]